MIRRFALFWFDFFWFEFHPGAQVEIIEHDDTSTAATNSNAPSHGDTVERNHNDRNDNVMGVLGVVRNALNGKGEQESMIGNSSDHKRNARSTPMNENEESDSNFSQSSSSTVPRKRLSVVFTHDGSPVFLRRKTSSSIGGTADSSRRNINRPPLSAHSEQNSRYGGGDTMKTRFKICLF